MRSVGPAAGPTVHAGGAQTARPAAAGFTLVELLIAISILAILLVVGMPSLSAWVASAKVNSMADFYLDGLRLARNGALQKSAASRFVLTPNANGQSDWQVDWCFPRSVKPCDNTGTTRWSTTTVAASGDINVANPSYSVFHSADSLPSTSNASMTLTPAAAIGIYYNAQGWVNTSVQPFLRQLRIDPAASFNPDPATPNVLPVAIAINLSGIAERCSPVDVLTAMYQGNAAKAAGDSRACSP